MIAVGDYGIGNVGSVRSIRHRGGADAALAPESLVVGARLILPGVESFDEGIWF